MVKMSSFIEAGICLFSMIGFVCGGTANASGRVERAASAERSLSWQWTGGPEGGFVQCLVTTPLGTILAGTENGGIFRSTDGGVSWGVSTGGIQWPCCNYSVPALVISGATVYAGTWGGGVFRSTDDGQSWEATGTIPGDGYPIPTAIAACLRGGRVYAGGNFGVVISEDGGDSWQQISDGLPSPWVKSLALRGTTLYARVEEGIYRLVPGATSWVPWNEGLGTTVGMQSILAEADALYLATHEGGVCHLDCSDSTWVFMNDGLWDDNVDAVVEVDQTLYAGTMGSGLFRYDDPSATWSYTGDGLWNRDIRSLTRVGRAVVAGTFGGGVLCFDTEFGSWSSECPGFTAPMITSMAYDGSVVYAGLEGGGVYRSLDSGDSWARSLDGFDSLTALDVAAGATAIFAATWNGVYKSTDQGQSWSAAGLQGSGIYCLDIWGDVLYAGSYDGRLWSSANAGQSWSPVGSGLPYGIVRGAVRSGTTLYAGVDGGGVYKLPDGQTTWTAMNAGLPAPVCSCLNLGGSTLYLGTGMNGVYRWNAGAQTWEVAGLENQTIFCLAYVNGTLMAGTWGGLFTSSNSGQTWTSESDGLQPWLSVRAIIAGGGSIFAGLGSGGVWRATNPLDATQPEDSSPIGTTIDVRPNPMTPGGRILFSLANAGTAEIGIFDANGRRVVVLHEDRLSPGSHEWSWDGRNADGVMLPAGVYMVRLKSGDTEVATKLLRLD